MSESPLRNSPKERRTAARFDLEGRVDYGALDVEGSGKLHDLSTSGARLDDVTHRLKPGVKLEILLVLVRGGVPLPLHGKVVRETETGFAVEFCGNSPRVKAVLKTVISENRQQS